MSVACACIISLQTIRQLESSRGKLENQERKLTAQFARQINMNQDLELKVLVLQLLNLIRSS